MPKPLRFKQRLDRYPPILVRLCATRGQHPNQHVLSDRQIVDASGLTVAEVKFVEYSVNWDDIPDRLKYPFLAACDIDLEKRRTFRRLEYMRRFGRFGYLRKSPIFESQLREMLDLWTEVEGEIDQ
jgi:hypothetical protein